MSFYCHGCASLFYTTQQLEALVNELLIIRPYHKQPCFRSEDGPVGLGHAKERRIKKILAALKDVGVVFEVNR